MSGGFRCNEDGCGPIFASRRSPDAEAASSLGAPRAPATISTQTRKDVRKLWRSSTELGGVRTHKHPQREFSTDSLRVSVSGNRGALQTTQCATRCATLDSTSQSFLLSPTLSSFTRSPSPILPGQTPPPSRNHAPYSFPLLFHSLKAFIRGFITKFIHGLPF